MACCPYITYITMACCSYAPPFSHRGLQLLVVPVYDGSGPVQRDDGVVQDVAVARRLPPVSHGEHQHYQVSSSVPPVGSRGLPTTRAECKPFNMSTPLLYRP